MTRNRVLSLLCLPVLALQIFGADGPSGTPAADSTSTSGAAAGDGSTTITVGELQKLREQIAKQQEEIKRLQQSVEAQQKALDKAVAAVEAVAPATNAAPVATVNTANAGNVQPEIVPAVNRGWHLGGQKDTTMPSSPLGISIGNTTFTPLGFVDATYFARSTNVGSGIGTNFGSIPFDTSATGHISENQFSTQNSRVGFTVNSTFLGAKVIGDFEADFLGQAPPTVFVTSNADTFRMRTVFVDVQKNGFEVLGGQDWSLATPNRVGLSPMPADIFYSQNEDTNYQLGLVWARQTQFRFIAHPSDNFAFGVSLENPEQYGGGGNGSTAITVPPAYASLLTGNAQINTGISVTSTSTTTLSGTGSGLTAATTTSSSLYGGTTTPNIAPDIIFKGAYDGHAGDKLFHVEAAGLVRNFRLLTGSGTSASPYVHANSTAFSGEFNSNLELAKGFHLIENFFYGEGGGRYIFGQAPDFIVTANGGISPIHSGSTVDGFEWALTKKTLVSLLYGGLYIAPDTTYAPVTSKGKATLTCYGYGCDSGTQNRALQEGTADVVQTLWSNPNYGKLSLILQYSYLNRNPWYYNIAAGAPKETHTNMVWVDLRYTLP